MISDSTCEVVSASGAIVVTKAHGFSPFFASIDLSATSNPRMATMRLNVVSGLFEKAFATVSAKLTMSTFVMAFSLLIVGGQQFEYMKMAKYFHPHALFKFRHDLRKSSTFALLFRIAYLVVSGTTYC